MWSNERASKITHFDGMQAIVDKSPTIEKNQKEKLKKWLLIYNCK